ncbi:DNA (cytosine-5-)-methyltransferase [Streptomyces sp. NPDC019208]|uniref:DNA cytosine methyltransferase n=1 Tax=Streptomyces sp. NPDC019208 TaxID=3154683 RepID=UPI0033C51D64
MAGTAYTSVEVCAGAGGQAIGVEAAGFDHLALIEIDPHACATLRKNRPQWNVIEQDLKEFAKNPPPLGSEPISLLAGGVPCPPFSMAGKQLGRDDERDLFPTMLKLVEEFSPRAVMIENVRGLMQPKFEPYRKEIARRLEVYGYQVGWEVVFAADYGVPQLRPRSILVALQADAAPHFTWPERRRADTKTVGQVLHETMATLGWPHADDWREKANRIAPTLVGGSKKHGGADLGPTRAKQAWGELGVDGMGVADEGNYPGPEEAQDHKPRLTVAQAALIQGFPKEWKFEGRKTAAYRQVGNAFPPPVAKAVASAIREALEAADSGRPSRDRRKGPTLKEGYTSTQQLPLPN